MTPPPGTPIQATPPEALAKLTARVTLVNAPVTVRDRKGAMVHNLEQQDFVLTDNGVPQKITHFDVGGDPISLVVVVETSTRIDPMLPQVRKAGILVTEQVMGPEAEAAVIGFDETVTRLRGFTRSHDDIESALAGLQTREAGTRLFDAMSEGVELLSGRRRGTKENPMPGRRVLLVIAEALDSGSETMLGEVLRRAQQENITIFAVGLSTTRAELQAKPRDNAPVSPTPPGINGVPPPPGTVPTTSGTNAGIDLLALAQVLVEQSKSQATKHSLDVGAAATGGAYYSTFKGRSIESAIDEIGGELHSQYVMSYTPEPRPEEDRDFGYHHIAVSLVPEKAKGMKVTTRPGYYIPPPQH
ncbi:MAG TPA: VWA domain-containing protein [Dongiaceae bacterium]|nr:VWA domain-containing protein [Dongiaceae bacterium]